MVKAAKIIPKRPRLIDALAKEQALEMAAAAATCKDPERRHDLEELAFRYWCDAFGRSRGRRHV